MKTNYWLGRIMIIAGIVFFIAGLFELTPTKIGYESMSMNFGCIYMALGYIISFK